MRTGGDEGGRCPPSPGRLLVGSDGCEQGRSRGGGEHRGAVAGGGGTGDGPGGEDVSGGSGKPGRARGAGCKCGRGGRRRRAGKRAWRRRGERGRHAAVADAWLVDDGEGTEGS